MTIPNVNHLEKKVLAGNIHVASKKKVDSFFNLQLMMQNSIFFKSKLRGKKHPTIIFKKLGGFPRFIYWSIMVAGERTCDVDFTSQVSHSDSVLCMVYYMSLISTTLNIVGWISRRNFLIYSTASSSFPSVLEARISFYLFSLTKHSSSTTKLSISKRSSSTKTKT